MSNSFTTAAGYEQSHILKVNPSTGIIETDWVLNDIGTATIEMDYRQTKPKLRDIDFDTVNNKIIAVITADLRLCLVSNIFTLFVKNYCSIWFILFLLNRQLR